MNFGMISLSLCIVIKQNYVIQILIALVIHIKTEDFYKDIANDVER